MRVIALVQARLGSVRLPQKVMCKISEQTIIELLLLRLSKSTELDEIVVATSETDENKKLVKHVESLGFRCTQGSEKDVLRRFYESAKSLNADIIVRITGDCPLVDPDIVDECVKRFKSLKVDYFSNISPASFPDGLDTEVFSFNTLEQANNNAFSTYDREHVTTFIRNSELFAKDVLQNETDYSDLRWSVDESEDLKVITKVFNHFAPDIFFSWKEVLELANLKPDIFVDNQSIKNNEGAKMGSGQKLYKRAKKIIPGGNMLLSKRPEMFLPDQWPSYFSKAKGCHVWDLDGKKYTDVSIMGIGTNTLGYGNEEVDASVLETISSGNMSTLNCP